MQRGMVFALGERNEVQFTPRGTRIRRVICLESRKRNHDEQLAAADTKSVHVAVDPAQKQRRKFPKSGKTMDLQGRRRLGIDEKRRTTVTLEGDSELLTLFPVSNPHTAYVARLLQVFAF